MQWKHPSSSRHGLRWEMSSCAWMDMVRLKRVWWRWKTSCWVQNNVVDIADKQLHLRGRAAKVWFRTQGSNQNLWTEPPSLVQFGFRFCYDQLPGQLYLLDMHISLFLFPFRSHLVHEGLGYLLLRSLFFHSQACLLGQPNPCSFTTLHFLSGVGLHLWLLPWLPQTAYLL